MEFSIKDICDINSSTISAHDEIDEILYLDTSNLTQNSIDTLQSFPISEAPSRAQRKVKHNTILYSSVRPNQRHYGIISNPAPNLIVSTGFITIDIKEDKKDDFDAHYIYFMLTQDWVTSYLETLAENSVSSYPSINPSDIENLKFNFPLIEEQKKISHFLENIENKIILNKIIVNNLNNLAKQIFTYWFFQFDFPDDNGRPFKTNGGKMVWNEDLKMDIPHNWDIKTLKDILNEDDINQINPATQPNTVFKHLSFPSYDECGLFFEEKGGEIKSNKIIVQPVYILAAKLNPWIKRITMGLDFDNYICSTEFVVLKPSNSNIKYYLYELVNQEVFINYCTNSSTGTSHSQRRVNPDIMKMYKFPFNEDIAIKISSILQPIIDETFEINLQNIELKKQQNNLLSQLMNGQVSLIE